MGGEKFTYCYTQLSNLHMNLNLTCSLTSSCVHWQKTGFVYIT